MTDKKCTKCKEVLPLNYLPYSILELKCHLESQFEDWMNWGNWGRYNPTTWDDNDPSTWTWQIDHIIPQAFYYESLEEDDFAKCWALDNLRPYSAKKNIKEANDYSRLWENTTTIITDLDGTLIEHKGDICSQHLGPAKLLPGVLDKIRQWNKKRYTIIIVTGRLESVREHTKKQLAEAGIIYSQLIMNVNSGTRILINDLKNDSNLPTAMAINVTRNKGMEDIDI